MVLLLRLAPVVPFAALNYAMGATSVRLWPYTWASALGVAPGAARCMPRCCTLAARQPGRVRARELVGALPTAFGRNACGRTPAQSGSLLTGSGALHRCHAGLQARNVPRNCALFVSHVMVPEA